MRYDIRYKPRASKTLRKLPRQTAQRILNAIDRLADDLQGDVKRLTEHEPNYRLRVGDYRVLFDIEGSAIIIYEVWHRQHDYR
ncbi:MAG: type II toxin-antitoxin system RelE/ParE family toxin [Phycisphaeraceae bacterium]